MPSLPLPSLLLPRPPRVSSLSTLASSSTSSSSKTKDGSHGGSGARPRVRVRRPWLGALAWIPVVLFVEHHVVSFATVSGRSMQPTLNPDSSEMRQDVVLLNRYKNVQLITGASKLSPQNAKIGYQIGDVVALRSPTNPNHLLIKRLIGLPGSLVRTLPPYPENTVRVPPGHCWIEGDERYHSRDSNTYGPVPMGLLDSKVEGVVWPLSRIGRIPPSRSGWEKRVVHPPSTVTLNLGASSASGPVRVVGGGL